MIDGEEPSVTASRKQEFAEEMLGRCVDRSGSVDLFIYVHHRPLRTMLLGIPLDSASNTRYARKLACGGTEPSTKSMTLILEMLPRIHGLFMDLPTPRPVINTFFPIVHAPRLRRFSLRQHAADPRFRVDLALSLFSETSTVRLEVLELDVFSLFHLPLPTPLVPHLRRLDVVTTLSVGPFTFTSNASQARSPETELSEYRQLEHIRLWGVDQSFLEI